MLDIIQLETEDEFTSLEPEWNLLLKQSPMDDAFLTWEWIHTWWKHYGSAYQLCLLVAREKNLLVGIAPFMLKTQAALGLKIRVLTNIGMHDPDVSGIIVQNGREDVLAKFAVWLVENNGRWDVLQIGGIPPGGMNCDYWTALFEKHCFTAQVNSSRFLFISMDGDWQKYYQRLSKKLRKDVHRNIRHIEQGKGYHYYHKRGHDATTQDMETIFQINKNARHIYLYRNNTEKEFHRELAKSMADRGWLDLYFLNIGEEPVAFYYGFWYNQTFEYWRTGFDKAYYPLSVGKVLLFLLIQDGFVHGMQYLNFLLGDEEYKMDWQVETRLFFDIYIVRNKVLPQVVYLYFPRLKILLRDFLTEHEVLHPVYKGISRLVNFRQNMRGSKKGNY